MSLLKYEQAKEAYAEVKAALALGEISSKTDFCVFSEVVFKNAFIEAKKEANFIHQKFVNGLEILVREVSLLSIALKDSLLSKFRELTLKEELQYCELTKEEVCILEQIGDRLLEEQKLEDASCFFLSFSQLVVPSDKLWLNLGRAEQKLGNYTVALVMYARASQLNPSFPVPYLYSAECYMEEGSIEEAKNLLDCTFSLIEVDKHPECFQTARALQEKLIHKKTF